MSLKITKELWVVIERHELYGVFAGVSGDWDGKNHRRLPVGAETHLISHVLSFATNARENICAGHVVDMTCKTAQGAPPVLQRLRGAVERPRMSCRPRPVSFMRMLDHASSP